jgi:hypothetical protein
VATIAHSGYRWKEFLKGLTGGVGHCVSANELFPIPWQVIHCVFASTVSREVNFRRVLHVFVRPATLNSVIAHKRDF